MTDDLGAKAPKYQRIADMLRREIKQGTYKPGTRLPSEAALTARFRDRFPTLSAMTLRDALDVLRAEGLIQTHHGRGSFVAQYRRLQRRSRHRYGRARADRQLLTTDLRHDVVYAGREAVPDHVATAAGLAEGTDVVVRRRILYDKETGEPREIGASYIPTSFAAGTYLEDSTVVPQALFLCVEELAGQRYHHAQDRWIARPATPAEQDTLRLNSGQAVVHLVHVARAADGTLLEVSESIWPADRIEILDEYSVASEAQDVAGLSDI